MRRVAVSFAVAACWVLCSLAPAAAEDSLPHNGRIAFTSDVTSYTVEPEGSNLRQLTNKTDLYSRLTWSPDGTEIAFTQPRMRESKSAGEDISFSTESISIITADGSNLRHLDTRGAYSSGPTWSPDGTKVAFSNNAPPHNHSDIFMMDLDGSNQINLTNSPNLDEYYPDISPNGSQICFFKFNPAAQKPDPGIYVMDTEGSDPTLLVEGDPEFMRTCDWSPDGTKIAFSTIHYPHVKGGDYQKAVEKAQAEGDFQKASELLDKLRAERPEHNYVDVYVINGDGSGRTKLTSNMAADLDPHWSPDGTKITFASDRDGDFDIYTMDADGSDVVQVTDSRNDEGNPDWQPLPGPTPPNDADGSDVAQGTKKPDVDDEDRDRPERTLIVKPGDSLWSISEQRLGPEASLQRVYDHTYEMYALNRKIIGADPDLIFAGQRLSLPPLVEG